MANGDDLGSEVAFVSGFDADGTVAATSFETWNQDTPATYSDQSLQFKWGSGSAGTPGGTVTYAFDATSGFSAAEQQVFLAGLALWSDEANITFAPAASQQSADFVFVRNADGDAFEDDTTAPTPVGASQVQNPTDMIITLDTRPGYYGPLDQPFAFQAFPLSTVVHEEGHMMGLGHTGPYNGGTAQSTDTAQFGPYDSQLYSVMSYISPGDPQAAFYNQYPVQGQFANAETPMIADILAVQRIYGAPTDTALSGGQTFGFNSNISDASRLFFDFTVNKQPVVTLFDTGTDNTLDLSGFAGGSVINLSPGAFSSCAGLKDNIAIADGTAIHRAVGGPGNDTIIGTTGNDAIVGGGGNDVLTGGGGHDAFVFGPGSGNDVVTDFATYGPESDALRFVGSPFSSIADALRHTSTLNGSATIHVDAQDSVTLLNVTKAQLRANALDIVLA